MCLERLGLPTGRRLYACRSSPCLRPRLGLFLMRAAEGFVRSLLSTIPLVVFCSPPRTYPIQTQRKQCRRNRGLLGHSTLSTSQSERHALRVGFSHYRDNVHFLVMAKLWALRRRSAPYRHGQCQSPPCRNKGRPWKFFVAVWDSTTVTAIKNPATYTTRTMLVGGASPEATQTRQTALLTVDSRARVGRLDARARSATHSRGRSQTSRAY